LLEEEKEVRKISANEWDGMTQRNAWAEVELKNAIDPNYFSVIWTPTLPCNYTCTYCGCAAGAKKVLKEFPSSTPEISPTEWLSFFHKLKELYPWGYLQTNGGEPLLSDATIPVLKLLSDQWAINLVTNGSIKIMELVRQAMPIYTKEKDYGLSVTLSLHPTSKGFQWDGFLGKALMLKNEGYLRGINFVGYPEQLYLFEFYRVQLQMYGISLTLQPWMGEDNKGFSGYTESEMEFVLSNSSASRTNNVLPLGDYASRPDFFSKISVTGLRVCNNELTFEFEITNVGLTHWDNEDIKLGVKLQPETYGVIKSIKEFRYDIPENVPTGASHKGELNVSLEGVIEDGLELIVDMVFEKKFWFTEQGSTPERMSLKKIDGAWQALVSTCDY